MIQIAQCSFLLNYITLTRGELSDRGTCRSWIEYATYPSLRWQKGGHSYAEHIRYNSDEDDVDAQSLGLETVDRRDDAVEDQ